MKMLDGALEGLSRLYIAVPPLLMMALLLTLFFFTSLGEARLQEASDRLQRAAGREQATLEFETALLATRSGARGVLLTGDDRERDHYRAAAALMPSRLERLRSVYRGDDSDLADIDALQRLLDRQLAALATAVTGTHSVADDALDAADSAPIAALIGRMQARAALDHADAVRGWSFSQEFSHWLTVAGTLFNILLVGAAARLVYVDMRRRTAQAAALREQKTTLEKEVEDRTQALVELSTHLQNVAEHEKERLAHELHDELGGLLVGARMDVSWAEQHLPNVEPAVRQRLARVQQSLAAGVDLKRRIIEELRPTLLDNVGLIAALRWQLKETGGRAGLRCLESYPDEETAFTSKASIALFRVAQEAFTNIVKHAAASTVSVALEIDRAQVVLRIADDGCGIPEERFKATGSHGLASMQHRIRALSGQFEVTSSPRGGTVVAAHIPTANAIAPGLLSATI
jgi:signal transduction histidine kinase